MNSLVQYLLPSTTDVDLSTVRGQTSSDSVTDPAAATWLSYQLFRTGLKTVQMFACNESDLSLEVENLTEVHAPGHGGIEVRHRCLNQ
jgi:hypothetical protein